MPKLTIAVTGAHSVLGSRLVRRLERDERVKKIVVLDLVTFRRGLAKTVFRRVDLAEDAATARLTQSFERDAPDVVAHLAFLQHPTPNLSYARELETLGTERLLHALRRFAQAGNSPALLLRSTTLVYGARAENPALFREDSPLAASRDDPFAGPAIEAERLAADLHGDAAIPLGVLRLAPLLGSGLRTPASRYLSLPAPPTILGFNPLVQALAVEDAVEAIRLAIARLERRESGVWNVAAHGSLPLLAAIDAAGRRNLPLPGFVAEALFDALFKAGLGIAPGVVVDRLRWPCLADTGRAVTELGFRPRWSTKDCVSAFARGGLREAA